MALVDRREGLRLLQLHARFTFVFADPRRLVVGPSRRWPPATISRTGELPRLPEPALRPSHQSHPVPSRMTGCMEGPCKLDSSTAEVRHVELHRRQAISDPEHLVRREGSPITPARHRLAALGALPIAFHLRRPYPAAR